jgi:general secretion pathway protein D
VAACEPVSVAERRSKAPDPFDAIRNLDLQPRFPRQADAPPAPPEGARAVSYFGREDNAPDAAGTGAGGASGAGNGSQNTGVGEGYELNFENTPVTTVAKVIIGDILGAGYTIDPRIQGTVSLSSGRPIAKRDLLFALENALRMSNVVLVPDGSGYRLMPAGDAIGVAGARGGDPDAGFGVTVVPVRYASAETIMKLLDSFAVKPGAGRADNARNIIIVQGTAPERRAALETILSFDVDWMRGQSVGIYPVKSATPDAVISELEKIMETGENGLNQNLIKLQAVARLNAVMVVAKKPNLLRVAATWISRLDRSNAAAAGVRVYRLKHGNAKQIAVLLSDMFGGKGGSGLDSAGSQIAPGGGATTTSTSDLGGSRTGGGFSSGLGGSSSSSTSGFGSTGGTTGTPGATGTGTAGGTGGTGGSATNLTSPGAVGGERQASQPTSVSLPGIRITADVANNALLIFANQENYRLIEQTLQQLDRPQLQVAIHATIAEISLNNQLQYGVQYYLKGSNIAGMLSNTKEQNVIGRVLPGFNLILGPENDPRVIIDALRAITDVKVLSNPSVVVIDNQVATLQVGEQVPIATQSATVLSNPNTPLVNTIDYRNTGVILRVLPRVNVNGNVILDVEQEISNVSQNANSNTLTPTVSQRKIKSSIAVASGQAVLLGGLIQERQERGRSGIPVLEEVPILGEAFARNSRTTSRTELIIFIQPQIIRDSVDAYTVAEELRTKLKGSAESAFPSGPSLRRDPLVVR